MSNKNYEKKCAVNRFGLDYIDAVEDICREVVAQHAGMVVAKTGVGGTRVVDMQLGEQLPRIC